METNISNDCPWAWAEAPLIGEAFNWMGRQVRLRQATQKCVFIQGLVLNHKLGGWLITDVYSGLVHSQNFSSKTHDPSVSLTVLLFRRPLLICFRLLSQTLWHLGQLILLHVIKVMSAASWMWTECLLIAFLSFSQHPKTKWNVFRTSLRLKLSQSRSEWRPEVHTTIADHHVIPQFST